MDCFTVEIRSISPTFGKGLAYIHSRISTNIGANRDFFFPPDPQIHNSTFHQTLFSLLHFKHHQKFNSFSSDTFPLLGGSKTANSQIQCEWVLGSPANPSELWILFELKMDIKKEVHVAEPCFFSTGLSRKEKVSGQSSLRIPVSDRFPLGSPLLCNFLD